MSVYQVWKTRHCPFFCFVRRFAERPPIIKTRALMSLCFSTVPRSSTAAFVIAGHRMLINGDDRKRVARSSARDKLDGDGSGVDLRRTVKGKTIWLPSCI